MSNRTTLKTYFLTGATPTEANFADLIDSTVNVSEDITGSLTTSSDVKVLSAAGGKALNDLVIALTARVVTLEDGDNSFASNYYTKTEVDATTASINNQFNTLPYSSQIAAIDARVVTLESVTEFAPVSHSHSISGVTGLQAELDLKASITYVQSLISDINTTISGLELGDESAEVASLQSQLDSLSSTVASLPTATDLSHKADTNHNHSAAEITDLTSSYYNKSETDALIANSQVSLGAHTHTESEITDLDKYTTGAVDLKLTDHNARTDNPHGVTKTQVSLGNVDYLSVVYLFQTPQAQAL